MTYLIEKNGLYIDEDGNWQATKLFARRWRNKSAAKDAAAEHSAVVVEVATV